jgi:Flp pilus assembly protein TadD
MMKSKSFLKIAASAAIVAGGLAIGAGSERAVQAAMDSSGKLASKAREIEKLLAKRKTDKAVVQAEKLVAASPSDARFRMLLGQAYLQAGRFKAASTSFSDVLRLAPGHDRAALNYALAQIALGRSDSALGVLEDNRDGLKPADYGLAVALAGNVSEGVRILEVAARGENADARTRQNLALAYALSGKWIESRTVMSQDLSPDLVDARIIEWASFVRPKASWDQVASLLKVTPTYDPGQPTALALNESGPVQQYASASPASVPASVPAPEAMEALDEAPAEIAPSAPVAFEVEQPVRGNSVSLALAEADSSPVPAISEAEPMAPSVSEVVFAPRQEIVQPIPQSRAAAPRKMASAPAPLIRASRTPAKQKLAFADRAPVAIASSASGRFVVQLGAYSSPSAAARAWSRNAGRYGLADRDPSQATVRIKTATLYRLSLSGFGSRTDAVRACGQIKSNGGNCFVRLGKSEAMPMWAKRKVPGKPVQLASRG